MNRLILPAGQTIQDKGELVFPLDVPEGYSYLRTYNHTPTNSELVFVHDRTDKDEFIYIKNRYPVGEYWIAEPWGFTMFWIKEGVYVEYLDNKIAWTTDINVYKKYCLDVNKNTEWRLPQHMPKALSRDEIKIVSVEVQKCSDYFGIDNMYLNHKWCVIRKYERIGE